MAPLIDDTPIHTNGSSHVKLPRVAIIGASSRGNAYARATTSSGLGIVVAVIEPIPFKRNLLGSKYIWHKGEPKPGQAFAHWSEFIEFEKQARENGNATVNAVFICVRDELHAAVVTELAPLELHVMCEKPLATTLADCLRIQKALQSYPQKIFAIGHVLRYSPHNLLLRDLVLQQKIIGDIISIEHTEPVGWWHYSHSYVRGQWRKESVTAPSLLTKSCHDIDWLMWMLCSPPVGSDLPPHLPSSLASTGSLKYFHKSRKPKAAGDATNCLSCPIEQECLYSAKGIYYDRQLAKGKTSWPVDIVNPEIETIYQKDGPEEAKAALMKTLAQDYNAKTASVADIEGRSWFGRCVWESDNDVCDDQHVTLEWEDDEHGRIAKSAAFHMVAQTLAQCDRRGWIYGTSGEIHYDSHKVIVNDFKTGKSETHHPEVPKNSHHGGGDQGITDQFLKAVSAVETSSMAVAEAQIEYMGCTLEEAVRSHAAVFAAEDARQGRRQIEWKDWWKKNVESPLKT